MLYADDIIRFRQKLEIYLKLNHCLASSLVCMYFYACFQKGNPQRKAIYNNVKTFGLVKILQLYWVEIAHNQGQLL